MDAAPRFCSRRSPAPRQGEAAQTHAHTRRHKTVNLRLGDLGDRVARLQTQLMEAGYTLSETHIFDIETQAAVAQFQHAHRLIADGIVGVRTRAALAHFQRTSQVPQAQPAQAIQPKHRQPEGTAQGPQQATQQDPAQGKNGLCDEHLMAAAATLDVPVTVIRAIHEVESRNAGFLADGRPSILFERHVFFRRLRSHGIDPEPHAHRYPGLVSTTPGGYRGNAGEHVRLAAAERIHRDAARESASWGAFQIMGYHWKLLGYDSLDDFIDRMHRHESDHLEAFIRFIQADRRLHTALIKQDWATFARGYNGPAYAKNLYDAKLVQAHARYVALAPRLA